MDIWHCSEPVYPRVRFYFRLPMNGSEKSWTVSKCFALLCTRYRVCIPRPLPPPVGPLLARGQMTPLARVLARVYAPKTAHTHTRGEVIEK